jgi:putative MATE family efflux protein
MDEILLNILSVSPDIFPYAKSYFQICMGYGIFGAVGPGINHFIRSDGHPKTSMFTQILGAAVNIILDPIFIFVFDLGIAGAAYATVISQFISFIWVGFYFNSKMTALRFRLKFMKLNLRLCSKILAIGFAPGTMQFAIAIVNALLNKSLAFYGGDIAVTSMGIAFSVLIIVFMPLQGLTQGVQPIIGYNYGAQKYDRAIKTFLLAALYATVFVCAAFIITHLFPKLIIGAFYNKPDALFDMSVKTLKITTLMFPLIGAQIIAANFFQAIDKPIEGAILGLSRQILVFIPLLLILPRFLGLDGIFITFPASDIICAFLTAIITCRELRKLKTLSSNVEFGM